MFLLCMKCERGRLQPISVALSSVPRQLFAFVIEMGIKPASSCFGKTPSGLEPINDTGGGLGSVRGRAGIQALYPEIWARVYQTAVFSTQGEVLGESKVSAAAVNEGGFRLIVGAGDESPSVVGGIKYDRAAPGQKVRFQAGNLARNSHDERRRSLMYVRLNVEGTGGSKVLLRVPGISVTRVRRQPAIKVIALLAAPQVIRTPENKSSPRRYRQNPGHEKQIDDVCDPRAGTCAGPFR